ncbi:MAG: tetratricopeptide repeat protein, partial [Rhodospirillaceae bacterium]|nr:tetratricopeptide repeat protein [Rhodospirillaceae bacterium]
AKAPTAAAWNDLGNVLADLGNPEEAEAAFHAAAADPAFAQALNNLGAVLASQVRVAAAAAWYDEALAIAPRNPSARLNLCVAQLEQGFADGARASFDAVLAQDPGRRDAQDNRLYAPLYTEDDPAVVAAEHRAWGAAIAPAPPLPPADPDPARRLRVGYVSPDFRRHSVAFFLAPFIGAHDRRAVEVFCYADVVKADMVTDALRSEAEHWRAVHGWSDEKLAAHIKADRIDILVDLAGHTQGNRLSVFARRTAPIQVTGIGYPATTGLAAMDYRLCDAVTDPPGADAFCTEHLMRLAPGLHCYAPLPAPEPGPLPALTAGHVTFGSFNKLAKISDATVTLWSRVLSAAPGSRLLVKAKALTEPVTRERLAARFAVLGIARDRLDLQGWLPGDGDHMGLYNRVDIALDTVPYNGTTTTCEALWMGVPVLTLAGRSHAARVSASLLIAAGLPEWIANTPEEFAAKARAADIAALAKLRASLREKVRMSPLCDAAAHARGLEAAYRAMWTAALTGSSAG